MVSLRRQLLLPAARFSPTALLSPMGLPHRPEFARSTSSPPMELAVPSGGGRGHLARCSKVTCTPSLGACSTRSVCGAIIRIWRRSGEQDLFFYLLSISTPPIFPSSANISFLPSINRSPRGIVLVIPREPINGKPSCRFDIQIENKSRVEATQEDAVRMIKAIFHPFTVEWDEVNWWSSYDGEHYSLKAYNCWQTLTTNELQSANASSTRIA